MVAGWKLSFRSNSGRCFESTASRVGIIVETERRELGARVGNGEPVKVAGLVKLECFGSDAAEIVAGSAIVQMQDEYESSDGDGNECACA